MSSILFFTFFYKFKNELDNTTEEFCQMVYVWIDILIIFFITKNFIQQIIFLSNNFSFHNNFFVDLGNCRKISDDGMVFVCSVCVGLVDLNLVYTGIIVIIYID